MEKENETPEVVEDVVEETTEETTDWETKFKEVEATNKELDGKYRRAKTKLNKVKEATAPKEVKEDINNQSDDPDYAKLAFLEQRGLKHADDQKMVQDEAKRLKLPLTDVLGMEHIITKLKDSNDAREAQEGQPQGGKRGSAKGQGDVDYHLAKGTTPDDLTLANKVIDARMSKEGADNMFSDELYTG